MATTDSASTMTVQGLTVTMPSAPASAGDIVSPPAVQTAVTAITGSSIEPPYSVLTVQFYWICLYSGDAAGGELSGSYSYTTGVTNSEEQTSTFAVSVGLTVQATPLEIGASVNATVSESTSTTTGISMESSSTTTDNFTISTGETTQFWQLYQIISNSVLVPAPGELAGTSTLTQGLNVFLSLSYPPVS